MPLSDSTSSIIFNVSLVCRLFVTENFRVCKMFVTFKMYADIEMLKSIKCQICLSFDTTELMILIQLFGI